MAKELSAAEAAAQQEKAKLKEEKKRFRQDQKAQKKEAKRRAAEIARQEEALGEEGGNGIVSFFATLLIVFLWLAIVCVVIRMNVGGIGDVLRPLLETVPVLNMILPPKTDSSSPSTVPGEESGYAGYASIEEAVAYIRQLELDLERAQVAGNTKEAENEALRAEVLRLQEFERRQVEFQRIMTEFYEEVVYSEKGPGLDAFMEWYKSMYPATAETLYKQGLVQQQVNAEVQELADMYSKMKPKNAAKILEGMTNDMDKVVDILKTMSVDNRAAIMDVLNVDLAAKITKMMYPDS